MLSDEQIEEFIEAVKTIGTHIKYLGGGDNTDHRGAVEVLSISLTEVGEKIDSGSSEIAGALLGIAEAIDNLAEAISKRNEDIDIDP